MKSDSKMEVGSEEMQMRDDGLDPTEIEDVLEVQIPKSKKSRKKNRNSSKSAKAKAMNEGEKIWISHR
jgi:hypothetical protein